MHVEVVVIIISVGRLAIVLVRILLLLLLFSLWLGYFSFNPYGKKQRKAGGLEEEEECKNHKI